MKLKTEIIPDLRHNGGAICVGWINSEDILSCGDDHLLRKTSVLTHESTILCKLSIDVTPLDMHWPTRSSGTGSAGGSIGSAGSTSASSASHPGGGKTLADIILITSADGKFHLISRTGRLERSVEAHQGACLVGKWSHDGAGFMTAGEDGLLKIWSRSGMLRSTLISCDTPIYTGAWAPDNQAICHSNGRILCVRSLAANTKPIRWKAHESLILKTAWCHTNGLIVSGGEDCRYRVWDSVGHPLYVSGYHDYPITSVAWSPSGDMFTVGGYNTIRVCDSTGWSKSLEKPQSGSLYQLNWSIDGTQIAAACANGHILYAHVVGKVFDWKHFSALIQDKRTILIKDNLNETIEQLDFPDRVIQVTLGFNYLVVATPTQCHVYSTNNWNTPVIFDLKEGAVCMLLSSEKYITIVERSNISVYNYQGRLIASPRWPGMYPESLSHATISLCGDMLVTRDTLDQRVIHIFDLSGTTSGGGVRTNTDSGTHIQHTAVVIELALSQAGVANDRQLAVIDVNSDLYLIPVREFGQKQFLKIGSQIQSLQWNFDVDILAVIQDGRLVVWYSPIASAYNPRMLKLSSMEQDAELGRNPRVHTFQETTVYVRRSDGSLVTILISPYIFALHKDVMENKWDRSLKLCRTIQDEVLWATMAALAVHAKMLEIAEEAFAAIHQHDKVTYIQYIKELPNRAQQIAGAAMLKGAVSQAESTLLHNGLLFHAINNNLNLYQWNRALDLALKHKSHIDTVLYIRNQYLNSLNKSEVNSKFLQLNSTVDLNEEAIKQKIDNEMKKNM